jgi:hypothetical protein
VFLACEIPVIRPTFITVNVIPLNPELIEGLFEHVLPILTAMSLTEVAELAPGNVRGTGDAYGPQMSRGYNIYTCIYVDHCRYALFGCLESSF